MDGFFLRPLPCHKPREVVRNEAGGFSYPEYKEYQRQCRALSGVFAETGHGGVLRDGERSHFVLASPVRPNFFSVLGLRAELRAPFAERAGGESEPAVVISHALWRRFFGGDPDVVGRTIRLGDIPVLEMGRWRFTGRNLLVMGQLALVLVFLAASGLLMIGFLHVLRLDPEIVPWRIETLREGLWRKTANAWAMVGLLSALCGLVCLLAIAGLYGLLALAVGAFLRHQLPGVPGTHLPILLGSALLILIVAVFASWVPGKQASRIDPMRALRCDR